MGKNAVKKLWISQYACAYITYIPSKCHNNRYYTYINHQTTLLHHVYTHASIHTLQTHKHSRKPPTQGWVQLLLMDREKRDEVLLSSQSRQVAVWQQYEDRQSIEERIEGCAVRERVLYVRRISQMYQKRLDENRVAQAQGYESFTLGSGQQQQCPVRC